MKIATSHRLSHRQPPSLTIDLPRTRGRKRENASTNNRHPQPSGATSATVASGRSTFAGHDRAEQREVRRLRVTRIVAILATLVGSTYLVWRAAFTLNPDALALSWLLWTLEAHAILGLGVFVFALWDTGPARPPTDEVPDGRVAVFVTTYDEASEALVPVIAAAVGLEGAYETWVLDDGNRPEVEELAHRLGASYLFARTTGTPRPATSTMRWRSWMPTSWRCSTPITDAVTSGVGGPRSDDGDRDAPSCSPARCCRATGSQVVRTCSLATRTVAEPDGA